MSSLFNKKTICLITGANRGLGKTIAIEFSQQFHKSLFILFSRNKNDQEITKNEMNSNNTIKTNIIDFSYSKKEEIELELYKSLDGVNISEFEQVITTLIVHNAGTLEFIDKYADKLEDAEALQKYWMVNLTSPIVLNSVFFRLTAAVTQKTIINISSICAIKPFKSWSAHSAGKAARKMLFDVLASEDPTFSILNYAPGPLNTDMQVTARTETYDPTLKSCLNDMYTANTIIETKESVRKLIHLLTKNQFTSGEHIDYYDIEA